MTDEVKFANSIDRCISKAVDMKLLTPVKDNAYEYEVEPLLRRFVDAEWLSEFNRELDRYMKENGLAVKETEDKEEEDDHGTL